MGKSDTDDTFEVRPTPVVGAQLPWRSFLAVTATGLSIVVVAALAGGSPIAAPPNGIAHVSPDPTFDADAARRAASPVLTRPIPGAITCHGIDPAACRLAVQAAVTTLDRDLPAVESADVWASLMCGDTFDCPPTRLDERTAPVGSVILRLFGGGPAARINVVSRAPDHSLGVDPTLEAWIARWQAVP